MPRAAPPSFLGLPWLPHKQICYACGCDAAGGSGSGGARPELSPSFLWLLRDFQFTLTEDGAPISTRDYMEETLRDMPGSGAGVAGRNAMRASIRAVGEQAERVKDGGERGATLHACVLQLHTRSHKHCFRQTRRHRDTYVHRNTHVHGRTHSCCNEHTSDTGLPRL